MIDESNDNDVQSFGVRIVTALLIIMVLIAGPFLYYSGIVDGDPANWISGSAAIAVLVVLIGLFFWWRRRRFGWEIVIGFLGSLAGLAIGLSQCPVVAIAVPVLVGAFGAAYTCETIRPSIGRVAVSFTLPLILAMFVAANVRTGFVWYAEPQVLPAFLIILMAIPVMGIFGAKHREDPYLATGASGVAGFAGLAVGLSETPVVIPVVPLVFTVLGGLLAFLFATKQNARKPVENLLFGFGTLLVLGLYFGAVIRTGMPNWWGTEESIVLFGLLLALASGLGWAMSVVGGQSKAGLGLAAMGGAIGFAIGLSETPVLYAIIPGVLWLGCGFIAQLLEARQDQKCHVGLLFGVFGVLLLLGGYLGHDVRLRTPNEILDQLESLQWALEETTASIATQGELTVGEHESYSETLVQVEKAAASTRGVVESEAIAVELAQIRAALNSLTRVARRSDGMTPEALEDFEEARSDFANYLVGRDGGVSRLSDLAEGIDNLKSSIEALQEEFEPWGEGWPFLLTTVEEMDQAATRMENAVASSQLNETVMSLQAKLDEISSMIRRSGTGIEATDDNALPQYISLHTEIEENMVGIIAACEYCGEDRLPVTTYPNFQDGEDPDTVHVEANPKYYHTIEIMVLQDFDYELIVDNRNRGDDQAGGCTGCPVEDSTGSGSSSEDDRNPNLASERCSGPDCGDYRGCPAAGQQIVRGGGEGGRFYITWHPDDEGSFLVRVWTALHMESGSGDEIEFFVTPPDSVAKSGDNVKTNEDGTKTLEWRPPQQPS